MLELRRLFTLQYTQYSLPAPLSRFVECVWVLRDLDESRRPTTPERVLPDGCIELIVQLGDPFRARCGLLRSSVSRGRSWSVK
jgi:hypothetical protein